MITPLCDMFEGAGWPSAARWLASACSNCGKLMPPKARPPICRKLRRDMPSQKRVLEPLQRFNISLPSPWYSRPIRHRGQCIK